MIGFKVFIDGDNFLEIQFLEVNIQSADKEVDYISLLQLTASERTECFEDVADFPVETVEWLHLGEALSILLQEVNVIYYRKHLRLKAVVCSLNARLLCYL